MLAKMTESMYLGPGRPVCGPSVQKPAGPLLQRSYAPSVRVGLSLRDFVFSAVISSAKGVPYSTASSCEAQKRIS